MNESVKNILEKVKETTKSAGNAAGKSLEAAGKKAGEVWEITRLNVQINDIVCRIEREQQKIGAMVYSSHIDPETDNSEIDDILVGIDEMYNQIDMLKAKIAEIKQLAVCKKCGKTVNKQDEYCKYCGGNIGVDSAENKEEAAGETQND